MSQLYVIVTNSSNTVVGKDVYAGDSAAGLAQRQAQYPFLTFTQVDEATFNSETFMGPNYSIG